MCRDVSLLKVRCVLFQSWRAFLSSLSKEKKAKKCKNKERRTKKANNKQKRNTLLKRKNAKHFEASKQGKKREVKVYLYIIVMDISQTFRLCNQEVLFRDY